MKTGLNNKNICKSQKGWESGVLGVSIPWNLTVKVKFGNNIKGTSTQMYTPF